MPGPIRRRFSSAIPFEFRPYRSIAQLWRVFGMSAGVVSVLFARGDSVYKSLPGCDVWDIDRDARRWPGGSPVVAHPPCRAWGQLRQFAKPRPDEKVLALWSVEQVREFGGVLEHPNRSSLWPVAGLPEPGSGADRFGGWTFPIHQHCFGHRAEKKTRLYIVGCKPSDLPCFPLRLDEPSHCIGRVSGRKSGHKLDLPKAEREHTPLHLAIWLLDTARRCSKVAS